MFRRCAVLGVLLILAAIAFSPAYQRWKTFQARRLAVQALDLMENHEWGMADRKIRDALSLRPADATVSLAVARYLSRSGQAAEAVDWWRRLDHSPLLGAVDHRDYAATALAVSDFDTATQEINLLMSQQSGPKARDLLLAGELALARGLPNSAVRYAERVLDNPESTSEDIVSGARLILQQPPLDSSALAKACRQLGTVARDRSDPAALDALILFAKRFLTSSASSPDVCDGAMTLPEAADHLDKHPNARGCHRIVAYDIRLRLDPSKADQLIAEAVDKFGHGDDETLIALGAWLYRQHRFEAELQVVSPDRASKKRELFIERVDALAAVGRTSEAEELLLSESSVVDPAFQHMYLAVVKSRDGETISSANEWERALENASSAQQLLMVADYAAKNGALEIADDAYDRVVIKQSNLRPAYVAHLRLAESMQQTAKAQAIAAKIAQLWPNDIASQMHETYLRLLLGASETETSIAEARAKSVLEQNPWHLGARMVLALARLKQGRSAGALEAVSESSSDPSGNVPPMAVRAAALTANGWKDKALEEAQKLTGANLLPEERALIAPLLAATE